jgi:hypothetical protein
MEELFKKGHEVEVMASRDRGTPHPGFTMEKHGNSGGANGGKDKKRLYAGHDTAPTPALQPNSSSQHTPNCKGGNLRCLTGGYHKDMAQLLQLLKGEISRVLLYLASRDVTAQNA